MDSNVKDIIASLESKIIIVEEYAESKTTFKKAIEKYYDYLKQGFEHRELRSCPIRFKFFNDPEGHTHIMELRHFVTNMMFWEPLVQLELYSEINEDYIVDCSLLSAGLIKDYIDNNYVLAFRKSIGNSKLNRVIHDMIYNLSRISTDFNILLGLSISAETFMDVARKNSRFNEIIRTKLDDNMQPQEVEATLDKLMHEEINILKTEDNLLKPILLSQTGIKEKQLAEFSINGGLKPGLDGNTIPITINSNFIVGGLGNITHYYIDSLGGRKSVIMNKTVMGLSGHFSRMVMLLATSIKLSKSVDDCGTLHPIELVVKTKQHLRRLKGRNYRELNSRTYKKMTGEEKHLIGKTILLRSPITCASKKICKTCYGDLFYTNSDIKSIGGFAGAKITEPLSQSILSSKHLLTTQSEKVEFNSEFYDYLTVNANEIAISSDTEDDVIDTHSLVILKENIVELDFSEETEFNTYVNIFHIRNIKTGEMYEMKENSGKELYMGPELKDLMRTSKVKNDKYFEIPLTSIEVDERIFVVEISNNELTKPLYNIIHLLDRKEHNSTEDIDYGSSWSLMAQRLLDLLIESKISSDSVHGEILIRPLIRAKDNILELPNFKRYDAVDNFQILTVSGALSNHPSVLISLSFERLSKQLINPLTFKKKEGSYIDPFFKERPQ